MAFQQLTLSQVSLAKTPSGITEMYIPLWIYSSATVSTTSATPVLVGKGTTSTTATGSATSANKLHTLNANWSPSQRFALEASIYISNSAGTVTAQLYDFTAGSVVSGTSVTTTSTSATLVRSGSVTLIPGHQYGVAINTNNGSYTAYLDKAHLIAFLS